MEKQSHRVNKATLNGVEDSSNAEVFRITIFCGIKSLNLLFESAIEVNAFLTALDAEF